MSIADSYTAYTKKRSDDSLKRIFSSHQGLHNGFISKNGRDLVNFSSNDYLGLSLHPLVKQKAAEYAGKYGAGATASRLVSGTHDIHIQVEQKLARLKKREAALLFPSGYQANISVIKALLDKDVLPAAPVVLADKYSHASIILGAQAADAKLYRYNHNDYNHLEVLLKKQNPETPLFIMSESVFSMDGDRADLKILSDLAERYHAILIIDDAHATGILGEGGCGLACAYPRVDAIIGTCSKVLGSMGGFVACSGDLAEYFLQKAGGFIYSTGIAPQVLGSIDAALDLLPSLEMERQAVEENAAFLRKKLQEKGANILNSTTHIVPLVTGTPDTAIDLSNYLQENGFYALPFRSPTVPKGTDRLRLSLTPFVKQEHLQNLANCL